ncbi:STM3941 family protein [Carboxylicivirga marina]|uniref:Uncharacterized protein n=1 Tax=Carboxylicivirga marina TaxID=2800988 RepID=A0ABS1HQN1_9BACT|nr:STM3941 family protein [Carboxylicivirga marina]MBK3519983.1 hypothetical protein [Carboxylicivirga marina]
MDRIEIYTSKKKSILILIGSIIFVVGGILFVANPESFLTIRMQSPDIIRIIGVTSVLFFGLGIYVGIKRTIKSEIALIIDSNGLNVNPKKSLNEFIDWKDILGFKELKIHSQRILIIVVKNPEKWIEKETNTFRKKLMNFNLSNYDSPFNISAAGLDISFAELHEALNKYSKKDKNEVQHAANSA